ncbi:MAG: PAS domain S-box protein [Thermodesulfobacteriota bacterium]
MTTLLRWLAAAWIGGALLSAPLPAAAADDFRVLVINSYHRGFTWSDAEETGVTERLRGVLPTVDISVEYLDAKRYPDEPHQRLLRDFLIRKYGRERIDMIVALDNPAMDMLSRPADAPFPGIPVVFAGISDYEQYLRNGRKGVTGVVERHDVRNTLEAALSFHPGTKTVLVVNDHTTSGLSSRREAEKLLPHFEGRVEIRFLPPSTFDEARTIIGDLPPDALLLIQSFATDRAGKTLSGADSTRVFAEAAKVPVYVLVETRLIGETVGGFLLDGRLHGRMAADLALRILLGMDPSSVPVEEMPASRPVFDYRQLKRFGIPLEKLPPGTVLVNRPETVFDTHREFAVSTIAAVAFLVGIVALLVLVIFRIKRTEAGRKRAEEALRLTQHCVDKAPVAFCTVSEDGRIESVNEAMCRNLGYTAEEFSSMTVFDFNTTITPESFRRHREEVYASGLRMFEAVYRRKDGSTFPVEVATSHLDFMGKRILYSFIKDVTERKTAEREQAALKEQLFQSQKMETVGLLAGGVAHDFNNLLTPILGYSELMLLGLPETDPNRQKLEQIHQAADFARKLTMRLLAFSRKQVLRLEEIDVGDIVRGLEQVLRRTIREDIRVAVLTGKSPGVARADRGQIEQALLNLAINAQDAMPDGGTLTIGTENVDLDEAAAVHPEVAPGPYVMLSVADTGVGMDEEVRAHIFEPFFTTKGPGKGTGLGLATVYGIVKQHGGHILVSSEKGAGSVFNVLLPRVEPTRKEAPPADSAPEAVPERVERGGETVMVAEDNPEVRALACRMLENLGYRVLAAESADECIAMAAAHEGTIHLLLTDVIMPERNGKELYELMKRDRPGLKSLFMSGYPGEVIGQHGILDEGVFFLQKPFTSTALSQQVRRALES